ncbi:viral A-type inclusion protein [Terrimonas sp. NA20]|uniref:Viral A-type inclusion protein n=1 Tax=Terrimonas ginsenosidimutans TaxID=2908004 RepID=A0ABS9KUS4_9BACT|nr:viral A-type inclusion protein [Terrimonas ginsenosidimutans]MCG2616061.1 viral A-type inclusion protein [Terrimonas ginsenosidimutans]
MKVLFFAAALCSLVFMSCGNESGPQEKSLADSLQKEVLDGHNVGMAKSRKLTQLQTDTKRMIDSIQKLPAKTKLATAPYLAKLDSLAKDLYNAEVGMNTWMTEFNLDSAIDNQPVREKYLADEKVKVDRVTAAILSSIAKADTLLKKK